MKYKSVKTEIDGIVFDSKKEAKRYKELKAMENAGTISQLRLQVPYELIPKQFGERACKYIADFTYIDKDGLLVVEDTKGFRTDAYKIKKKLMLYRYGIRIKEI